VRPYIRYLWYVIRHKWYVFLACWRVGLVWHGLTHDLSKFLPSEFIPYARHFYGEGAKEWRDRTGYYKPTDTGDAPFDFAWLLHQKRNRHHWQWWILPEDEGGVKVLPMEDVSLTEMICDWKGAGLAQGKPDIRAWWDANNHKMQLHRDTRRTIEDYFCPVETDAIRMARRWSERAN
jgi:hypothetical protein